MMKQASYAANESAIIEPTGAIQRKSENISTSSFCLLKNHTGGFRHPGTCPGKI